jgi:hypothetical protein
MASGYGLAGGTYKNAHPKLAAQYGRVGGTRTATMARRTRDPERMRPHGLRAQRQPENESALSRIERTHAKPKHLTRPYVVTPAHDKLHHHPHDTQTGPSTKPYTPHTSSAPSIRLPSRFTTPPTNSLTNTSSQAPPAASPSGKKSSHAT